MIFDPIYWIFIGAGVLLSLWASARVKGTFAKFSRLATRSNMTGGAIAESILRDNGIYDVRVEPVPGNLTDHYDPRQKVLRLSEPVYGGRSMAAFGVAAHEVGHAIQDAKGYEPLKFRSLWVPAANTGTGISMFVLFAAVMMGGLYGGPMGVFFSWLGLALFATTTIFTLVTLPVEFDASRRALVCLEEGRYVTREEHEGAKKVLDAAAMTYVAAFVTSLLTLIYWAYSLGLFGGRGRSN